MKYELTHHGVRGQKWGSRNGPPYPLNAAGKASLAKQKKASGGSTSSGPDDTSKKKIKVTRDAAGHVTKVSRSGGSGTSPLQKLKKAIGKKSEVKKSAATAKDNDKLWNEFTKTKEYKTAAKEALDTTVEYYKTNEPETLKKMLKEVNGDVNKLEQYSLFRKDLEGFTDIITDDRFEAFANKKSTTKYSAELMERESRYGLNFEDDRVPKTVKESVEYKRYKEAQERYKKEFNKNPDSEEAVQAYEQVEDAGHDLSRLVKNLNESGGYGEYKPSYSNIPADKMTKPSEMSPEELQSFKAKTIREGDVKTVQANRNLYSDDEIMAAITRNNINKQLTEITAKDVKSGAEKVDNIISGIQRTTKLVNTGVDAWNTVAKISTSLGVDLPVLDGSRPGSNSAVYDRKSKAQLEKMIANPQKYTAKEIEGMKDAYDKLVKAQNAVRAEKNKNLGLTEAYVNKGKYTEAELDDAIRRANTLKRLQEATAAKQEEHESYATMKAEIFKAAADDKKWFSENGKPWWDDDKLKL